MFSYDLQLALHSLSTTRGLVADGARDRARHRRVHGDFTIYHAMHEPIPDKSDRLHAVTLDTWSADRPYDDDKPTTRRSCSRTATPRALRVEAAARSLVMYKSGALLLPEREGVKPFTRRCGSRPTSSSDVRRAVPVRPGLGRGGDQGPEPWWC